MAESEITSTSRDWGYFQYPDDWEKLHGRYTDSSLPIHLRQHSALLLLLSRFINTLKDAKITERELKLIQRDYNKFPDSAKTRGWYQKFKDFYENLNDLSRTEYRITNDLIIFIIKSGITGLERWIDANIRRKVEIFPYMKRLKQRGYSEEFFGCLMMTEKEYAIMNLVCGEIHDMTMRLEDSFATVVTVPIDEERLSRTLEHFESDSQQDEPAIKLVEENPESDRIIQPTQHTEKKPFGFRPNDDNP